MSMYLITLMSGVVKEKSWVFGECVPGKLWEIKEGFLEEGTPCS